MSSQCPPELKAETHEQYLANLLEGYLHAQKQVTRLQTKCNELLEEIRVMKGISPAPPKPKPIVKLVYVAGPYRSSTDWGVEENIFRARRVGAQLAQQGVFPVIPQANTAHFGGIQPDPFWLSGTLELMRRCDAVLLMPGSQASEGACAESSEAETLGIPVYGDVAKCAQVMGWASVSAEKEKCTRCGKLAIPHKQEGWGIRGYALLCPSCLAASA